MAVGMIPRLLQLSLGFDPEDEIGMMIDPRKEYTQLQLSLGLTPRMALIRRCFWRSAVTLQLSLGPEPGDEPLGTEPPKTSLTTFN
jgi:hypothetical protein